MGREEGPSRVEVASITSSKAICGGITMWNEGNTAVGGKEEAPATTTRAAQGRSAQRGAMSAFPGQISGKVAWTARPAQHGAHAHATCHVHAACRGTRPPELLSGNNGGTSGHSRVLTAGEALALCERMRAPSKHLTPVKFCVLSPVPGTPAPTPRTSCSAAPCGLPHPAPAPAATPLG